MLRFLYQATDSAGVRVVDEIDATSAAAAMAGIQAKGLTHVELLDLEDMARLRYQRAQTDTARKSRGQLQFELKARRGYRPWVLAVAQMHAMRWHLLCDVTAISLGVLFANAWLAWSGVLFLGGTLIYLAYKQMPAYLYQVVLRADAFGNARAVESALLRLRKKINTDAVLFDLDVRLARARARSGSPAEQEATLKHWRERVGASYFEARMASLYFCAGDYEGALARTRLALDLSGGEAAKRLDYALCLARVGDVALAEAEIAAVSLANLPAMAGPFLAWTQGLIALRKNMPELAARHLTLANAYFVEHADNVAHWTSLAVCTGGLALAMSRMGKRREAAELIAPMLPIFNVWADKNLRFLVEREVLQKAD